MAGWPKRKPLIGWAEFATKEKIESHYVFWTGINPAAGHYHRLTKRKEKNIVQTKTSHHHGLNQIKIFFLANVTYVCLFSIFVYLVGLIKQGIP